MSRNINTAHMDILVCRLSIWAVIYYEVSSKTRRTEGVPCAVTYFIGLMQ